MKADQIYYFCKQQYALTFDRISIIYCTNCSAAICLVMAVRRPRTPGHRQSILFCIQLSFLWHPRSNFQDGRKTSRQKWLQKYRGFNWS